MLPVRAVLSYSKQVEELTNVEIRPVVFEDFGNLQQRRYLPTLISVFH